MNTIYGWIGLGILLFDYLLLLRKEHKYFFHIGAIACLFYFIHAIILVDYSIMVINLFLCIVSIIKAVKGGSEYEKGYNDCLDNHNIVHGEDAEKLIEQVNNPKSISKEQKKFLKECDDVFKSTKK